MSTNLLAYSRGAGCGCKIAPEALQKILHTNSSGNSFRELLVGNEAMDDAAVWALNESDCLISTTDFFTPIVAEAFWFGKIAAVNAISDVYAMGGTPTLALGILGWPIGKLPLEEAAQVMEGARAACAEAGIPLAGGHSIDAAEPFFGLSVNGMVKKQHLKQNNTCQPGARLLLSKPLGTGILSSAAKRELLQPTEKEAWYNSMLSLNKVGTWLGQQSAVQAMTDITGFGLLGHALEMAKGSAVGMILDKAQIPMLVPDALKDYMNRFVYPDGTTRNYQAVMQDVSGLEAQDLLLLCDPQTSGGLLVAVDENHADQLTADALQAGFQLYPIGFTTPFGSPLIQLR